MECLQPATKRWKGLAKWVRDLLWVATFSCPLRKPQLPPCLVQDYSHRIRQIQTSILGPHGDAQYLVCVEPTQNARLKTSSFRSENECIALLERHFCVMACSLRAEREGTARRDARQGFLQRIVDFDVHPFVVVQTRPAQLGVVQIESQWAHKVQFGPRVGAEPNYVSGIGRNLRLEKNYPKHLHIQIRHGQRVPFYERPSRLDLVPHQSREHRVGSNGVFNPHLKQTARVGVHRRFP